MVVFTCNHCGDSLQKPKVAKHYQFQCRNPIFLTCVDCHSDFRLSEYETHTKCVSENERYGAKNSTPVRNANKGEKKQLAWINVVQDVLENSKALTMPEKNFLNSISSFDNIPRKKPKFLNFIKNIQGPKVNMNIVESVWTKMETAFKDANSVNNMNHKNVQKSSLNDVKANAAGSNDSHIVDIENSHNCVDKTTIEEPQNEVSNLKKRKKVNTVDNSVFEKELPAKKKCVNVMLPEHENTVKFNWKSKIVEILNKKQEISLKKLRKKVIKQYLIQFPDCSHEKANKRFDKKLAKISEICMENEIVYLNLPDCKKL